MLPLVGIPKTIVKFLKQYRNVFCKEAVFQHISRYINGLLMSPNKTLQGIYSQLVWDEEQKISRRAMHEAVFEAGWKHQKLIEQHRKVVSSLHQGEGREIIALDWTFSYHPYSQKIFAAKEGYDYVNRCWSCFQTVVTASISNGQRIDGIAVEVQHSHYQKEELAYLQMTARENYEQMEQVKERLLELLHYQKNRYRLSSNLFTGDRLSELSLSSSAVSAFVQETTLRLKALPYKRFTTQFCNRYQCIN